MRRVLRALYGAIPGKREMFMGLRLLPAPPRVYRHRERRVFRASPPYQAS
jgi:hypothetical protein